MNERLPSWEATDLVAKAWRRIDPPRQKELARRLGLTTHTNLSKLNRGTMPMTQEYGDRIVEAVRQDDPTFTLADLGAPASVVAEVDPTVLDRLEELATAVTDLTTTLERFDDRLLALDLRVSEIETPAQPASRRKRRTS